MDTTSQELTHLPFVSIVMPTYNRKSFITAAIASVLTQTYQNWELIIVDDASTDDTEATIEACSDSRIRYFRHDENQGISKTRNHGLQEAQGEYIAVLDSDDIWTDPTKLRSQVTFLEQNSDYILVGTFITHIDAQGTVTGKKTYHTDDRSIRNRMLLQNQFAHSSVLMRKSTLDKTAGYREKFAEDYDLFLQLGTIGKFANIFEYMTGYRIHGNNISRKKLAMAKALQKIIKRHAVSYPHASLALFKNRVRMVLAYFG